MPVSFNIDLRTKLGRTLTRLQEQLEKETSDPALVSRVFRGALDDWGLTVLDPQIQENLAGRALKRRTGQLANRTRVKTGLTPSGGKNRISVEIQSTDVPYARIQELGGTIRAGDKLLTIPLPAALTAAGVLRNTAAELQKRGDTFVARSKKGNLIIFKATPKSKSRTRAGRQGATRRPQLVPLFVLKDQVTIEPSNWASTSADEALKELGPYLDQAVQEFIANLDEKL